MREDSLVELFSYNADLDLPTTRSSPRLCTVGALELDAINVV